VSQLLFAHGLAQQQAADMALKGAAVIENVASAVAHTYVLPVLCAVLKFSRMKLPVHRASCNL